MKWWIEEYLNVYEKARQQPVWCGTTIYVKILSMIFIVLEHDLDYK